MLWKGFILTAAISMSLIGTSSVAFARGCSSIPCRCAVQNGGSYNPATDRWSMAGCTGAQFQAFNDCVGRQAFQRRQTGLSSAAQAARQTAAAVAGHSLVSTTATQSHITSVREGIQRQRKAKNYSKRPAG
jgi:hypothetical protein